MSVEKVDPVVPQEYVLDMVRKKMRDVLCTMVPRKLAEEIMPLDEYDYVCIASCYELDYDNSMHCHCKDFENWYERYPDGCPCGNNPIWVNMEEFK